MVFSRTFFAPIGYLWRSQAVKECIPSLHVNEDLYGQNWQLMLPICSKYKIGYIDRPLFCYLVRKDSLSHKSVFQGYEEKVNLINEYERTVLTVLCDIGNVNITSLVEQIKKKYMVQRMLLDIRYKKTLKQNEDIFKMGLIIWGTGNVAKQIILLLKDTFLFKNILYFVDNDPAKWGKDFEGFMTKSPSKILDERKDRKGKELIVIANSYYLIIRKQLLQSGYIEWVDFVDGTSILL